MNHKEIKQAFETFYLANKIDFDERRHEYKLDGVICAGISSISEYRPKNWMPAWGANMAVGYIQKKILEAETGTVLDNLSQWIEEARKAYARKSKDSLGIGSKVHDWLENHIKGTDLPITEDIKHPVEQFLKFEKKHKVKWICVEKIVCSPEHLVAGRLDSLAFVDGKLSLIDFKTSSHIDEGYFLQTAGYAMCLEDMGIPVEQRIILRLPKDGDDFEAVLVETDYELDKKAFLNLRYAWQWANYIDSKFKERPKGSKFKELKLTKI